MAAEREEISQTLKDFGDLGEVFDKVFPATAEKKEEAPPAETKEPAEAEKQAEAEPEKVVTEAPPKETAPADDLPDFLIGKAPEEPAKPAEEELPPPRANESVGMKQLRTAYEKLKATTKEKEQQFSTQIEELKKRPEAPPDLEAKLKQVETERDQYREAVERSAIEFSPYVQQKYAQPRANMVNLAHQTLKEAGADPAEWDSAMAKSGPARIEALEEIYQSLPESVKSELGPIATGIRNLDLQKQSELSDRKGMLEKVREQQLIQQRDAFQRHEQQTVRRMEMAEKELVEKYGFEVLRKSEKPEHRKWNESVDEIKSNARKILLEVDDEDVLARAAYAAASAPYYRNLYHIMRDRWQEAVKQNKAVEDAEPDAKTRGEQTKPEDEGLSFAEAVAKGVYGS